MLNFFVVSGGFRYSPPLRAKSGIGIRAANQAQIDNSSSRQTCSQPSGLPRDESRVKARARPRARARHRARARVRSRTRDRLAGTSLNSLVFLDQKQATNGS